MHPVEDGQAFSFGLPCYDFIGEQHEGLDQAVALQSLDLADR